MLLIRLTGVLAALARSVRLGIHASATQKQRAPVFAVQTDNGLKFVVAGPQPYFHSPEYHLDLHFTFLFHRRDQSWRF
jgi:hypothetical protein